ncbi:O-methyltransferase ATR12 [Hyphodiscus hymeniophilus]|uniref:O-methyltransferase ATR12 n=1 Tax=Hyphodiscus hymeniophilus TaxID=353542 RepID=A0A9P6VL06_9HELO|nr:O-methyltransferase ATR12 [Hyphodiscus hymeniophilus]
MIDETDFWRACGSRNWCRRFRSHALDNLAPGLTFTPPTLSWMLRGPSAVSVLTQKGMHDLEEFRLRCLEIAEGSLTLQDLPSGAYDFFTPEPVKAVRIHLKNNLSHDWTDWLFTKILGNVASAIERGYSRTVDSRELDK